MVIQSKNILKPNFLYNFKIMEKIIITIIIGILGGTIGSALGLSGAFFIIPLLIFFGITSSQLTAQGTTLFMLLPPISLYAVYVYYKNKHVNIKIGLLLIAGYVLGTLIGSNYSINLSEKRARMDFAILLLLLSGYMFYKAYHIKNN